MSPHRISVRPSEVLSSNEDLLVAVSGGDKAAFRKLYDATTSALYPICLRMLRDRDAANEVFQDAFFRIWQKAHLYDREKGSALGWMITIARRSALDRLASSRNNAVSLDDIDEELVSTGASRLGAGSVESVILKKCLEKLEAKFSRAILMTYFYGLTHEELAKKLAVPLGTAKSWVTRGLTQLQDCMG